MNRFIIAASAILLALSFSTAGADARSRHRTFKAKSTVLNHPARKAGADR